MHAESRQFLHQLLSTPSPSGFEQKVQAVVRQRLAPFAEQITTDVHGNVMAVVNRGGSPRVMLAGHCDEVGLMVTHIDEKGFLYFDRIGGPDSSCMLGMRVRILAQGGDVFGVIGKKPIHLEKADERGRTVKPDDLTSLFIDIGAASDKEAAQRVCVGDPIVYEEGFADLTTDRFIARGTDDRVGVFVVCETLARLARVGKGKKAGFAPEVWAVSSVQEEVGLRGAHTACFAIDPAVGIAVDVGFCTDYPGMDPKSIGLVKLGQGPIVGRGANINPVLEQLLSESAAKGKIKVQRVGEPRIPGTDANPMQINARGVATAIVGIPNRYMHTPVEMISYADLGAAVELLVATMRAMKKDHDFTPR